MRKHFNKGTVWGVIKKLTVRKTRENSRPYAELEIACPSDKHGNITAYGRLWGPEKIEELKKAFRTEPGRHLKFTGNLSQFSNRDRTITGFNFYLFEPAEEGTMRGKASFILVGEVSGAEIPGNDMVLQLTVKRDGSEETFRIHADPDTVNGIGRADVVQINGALRDVDAEWGSSGDVKPWAYVVKGRQEKEATV